MWSWLEGATLEPAAVAPANYRSRTPGASHLDRRQKIVVETRQPPRSGGPLQGRLRGRKHLSERGLAGSTKTRVTCEFGRGERG